MLAGRLVPLLVNDSERGMETESTPSDKTDALRRTVSMRVKSSPPTLHWPAGAAAAVPVEEVPEEVPVVLPEVVPELPPVLPLPVLPVVVPVDPVEVLPVPVDVPPVPVDVLPVPVDVVVAPPVPTPTGQPVTTAPVLVVTVPAAISLVAFS